jgi:hypothetical protein
MQQQQQHNCMQQFTGARQKVGSALLNEIFIFIVSASTETKKK